MSAATSSTIAPVKAAGIITQAARGVSSFLTKALSDEAPTAPSLTSWRTARLLVSNTTHSCPSFMSRRTRFDPIRPRPIIPSCIRDPPW